MQRTDRPAFGPADPGWMTPAEVMALQDMDGSAVEHAKRCVREWPAIGPGWTTLEEHRARTEQLVLSALHVACHGERSERQHIDRLAGRVDETLTPAGAATIAEAVLAATFRSAFAALHPVALAQTCQAVEEARAKQVPQLRALDGGSHWRPE